jgi:glycosyltransferase involved in cell wall biosynthesis
MGETARRKAVERFAWRAVAQKTLSVYEKAIEEKL